MLTPAALTETLLSSWDRWSLFYYSLGDGQGVTVLAQVKDGTSYVIVVMSLLTPPDGNSADQPVDVQLQAALDAAVQSPETNFPGALLYVSNPELGTWTGAAGLGNIIPAKSDLSQNYPNPFNPETWIPYQLKDATSISIKIYSASGQLIRTLNLGHKNAGVYISWSKSAYWDGKNEAGEEVAIGKA